MGQPQGLAGQGALVVGQEGQRIGHVLHSGEHAVHGVPQHDVLHHFLLGDAQRGGLLGDLLFHQRRLDEAGADGIGVDAVVGALPGDGLGQACHAVLGEVVGLFQLGAHEGLDGAGEHDAPALAGGLHPAEGRPGNQEGAVGVNGHHLLPVVKGILVKGMDDLDAGVGHDQIAGAVGLHHLVEAGLHLFLAGYVHADGDGAEALGRQLADQLLCGGHVHVGHHHAVALPGHSLGAGLADAGSGAGDQCRSHGHNSSSFCFGQGADACPVPGRSVSRLFFPFYLRETGCKMQ